MNLVVVVPSRGRPWNVQRLAGAFRETADFESTDLAVVVNEDDGEIAGYRELADEDPWVSLTVVPAGLRVGPILNAMADLVTPFCNYIGFMGDDHLPRTAGWDKTLTSALDGGLGVAYGNDLHQGDRLPTACIVSAALVRTLGYFSPPGLIHLYLDNFWLLLGLTTRLAYFPDVIIEHVHPEAGKADLDDTYRRAGLSGELMAEDGLRWASFLGGRWPLDREKVLPGA